MNELEIRELFAWFESRRGVMQIDMNIFQDNLMVNMRLSIRNVDSIQCGCGFDKVYSKNPLEIQAAAIKKLRERIGG